MTIKRTTALLAVAIAAFGCSSSGHHDASGDAGLHGDAGPGSDAGSGVTPAPDGAPYQTLAEWHLFTDLRGQVPSERVVPYEVISQLFADYASKRRFIYVPVGQKIGYSATEKWSFPVGTILVKTFSYLTDTRDPTKGETFLETRLLIHEADGWTPHTYVWNAAQTGATLDVAGAVIDSQFIDPSGNATTNPYVVPSENDCRTCHGRLGSTNTIGGRTRQLDRDHDYGSGPENQIDHLAKLGLFDVTPDAASARTHLVDPFGTASVSDRLRSYVDGNCAHCHQPGNSPGSLSGLWLDYPSTDPVTQPAANYGFCKQPASAGGATCGRQFDVVPEKPSDSIITCRLEASSPKVKMPPVGRNLVHAEGLALVTEWINSLPGACGGTAPTDAGHGVPTNQSDAGRVAAPSDAGRD